MRNAAILLLTVCALTNCAAPEPIYKRVSLCDLSRASDVIAVGHLESWMATGTTVQIDSTTSAEVTAGVVIVDQLLVGAAASPLDVLLARPVDASGLSEIAAFREGNQTITGAMFFRMTLGGLLLSWPGFLPFDGLNYTYQTGELIAQPTLLERITSYRASSKCE